MKRLGVSFGSREPREPHPSLFNLITLITYLFTLLPFACLVCLCAGLCSRRLALTHYPTWCVGLSTYVISLFVLFVPFHQSFYSCLFKVFLPKFFFTFPPWVLSPIFSFFSLSCFFDYPFTFLTCFSQLAFPA
jgi:hypothetical protein